MHKLWSPAKLRRAANKQVARWVMVIPEKVTGPPPMLKASEFLNPPKPTLSGRLVSNSGEEMLSRFQLRERRDLRIVEDFKAGKRLDELADLYRIGEGRVRIILKEHGCGGRQK